MNLIKNIALIFLLSWSGIIIGQTTNTGGHYLFEAEKFSPPIKDMIASYEGFPATPFMANNLEDEELYIGNFKGKPLILLFWSAANPNCLNHLDGINRLSTDYKEKLEIVSFADDDRNTMNQFVKDNPLNFHVIPNSKIFGEAAYGNELGYPRAFIIDESGVIRKVVPEEAFNKSTDSFEMLKSIVVKDLSIINE